VISPYPFMDASASLRVLHQMAAAICAIPLALASTTRKTVALRFGEHVSLQLQIYADVAHHSFRNVLSACYRTASRVETQVTSVTFLGIEG